VTAIRVFGTTAKVTNYGRISSLKASLPSAVVGREATRNKGEHSSTLERTSFALKNAKKNQERLYYQDSTRIDSIRQSRPFILMLLSPVLFQWYCRHHLEYRLPLLVPDISLSLASLNMLRLSRRRVNESEETTLCDSNSMRKTLLAQPMRPVPQDSRPRKCASHVSLVSRHSSHAHPGPVLSCMSCLIITLTFAVFLLLPSTPHPPLVTD